jgi:hypothetical protein
MQRVLAVVRDRSGGQRQRLAQKLSPGILRILAVEFAGVRGTELYNDFASGNYPYYYFVYRKHLFSAPP